MPSQPTGSLSGNRPAWLYFIAVMLAYALVILSTKNPPCFVDYPDWVYQGVLFRGVITGHPIVGYALKSYPVPNSLTTVGIGVLNILVSWQWAGKLWVCFYLLLTIIATFMLSRALPITHRRMIAAVPAIIFLNIDFWYGHVSFEIGMCLLMIFIAMTLRNAHPVSLAALLIIIFFAHMEALACAVLFAALWAASTHQWKSLWIAMPAMTLTAWYAIARFANGDADIRGLSGAGYAYGSKSFLIYKANTFFKIFGYVNARATSGRSLSEAIFGRPLFVLLAMLSLVVAALILVSLLHAMFSRGGQTYPYLRAFVLILLCLALTLPQVVLGTADPGSRLLLVAAVVGLFLVDWRSRTAAIITAFSIIFCAANLWQFVRVERDPAIEPHRADLPVPLLTYGHVEPQMRAFYYQHLSASEMDLDIFPTGMFLHQAKSATADPR